MNAHRLQIKARWRIAIGIVSAAQIFALAAAILSFTDSNETYWLENFDNSVKFGLVFVALSIANLGLVVAHILKDKS